MKKAHVFAAALAALMIAGPAMAQWPPPPPPFAVNPKLTPPPGTPSALPQQVTKQQAKAQAKAQRQAARAERKMTRAARANACHRQADEQGLAGKQRRRFVSRCRHGR